MTSKTTPHALWITLLLAATLGLSGCFLDDNDDDVAGTNGNGGGSGADEIPELPEYTGSTNAAVVTGDNVVDISVNTHQAVQAVIDYEQATQLPVPSGISASGGASLTDMIGTISSDLVQGGDNTLPTGAITVRRQEGECGGEVTLSLGGLLDYQDYCTVESGVEMVVNGFVHFDEDTEGVRTLGLRGVSIAVQGVTRELSADVICHTQETPRRCYFETNIEADDGQVYRVENAQVAEDESTGAYLVSARVFNPELGYVDVLGTDLQLCEAGGFTTGNIVASLDEEPLYTLEFSGCASMTLTHNEQTQELMQ